MPQDCNAGFSVTLQTSLAGIVAHAASWGEYGLSLQAIIAKLSIGIVLLQGLDFAGQLPE